MPKKRESKPVFDRTPPQNLDAERSVLGAMLLNPDAVGVAIEVLRETASDVFYADQHQHIYAAIIELFRQNKPIDGITLTEQLTRTATLEAAGGISYIAELTSVVPTSASVVHYATIVLQTAVLRKLISTCTTLASEAYAGGSDVEELLDRAEANIFSIAEARQVNPIYKVSDLTKDAVHRIEDIIKSRRGHTGLPTGFARLDELLSGLQASDMIVLAARPSVGKTAFALSIAANASIRQGKSVLIFSLEMAKEQLVQRLLCMEGRINSKRLRSGFLAEREFPNVQRAADKLNAAPIFIDDTAGISVLDIRSKTRRHAAQHGVDLIIIDYMQLMQSTRRVESRQIEISEISRSIKSLARELSVPIIAISQLSREAERDDSGVPKLSHLRESGAIEQDADVVLMLSRPAAHKVEEIISKQNTGGDSAEEIKENLIQVHIAKQRNGPTGLVYLVFDRDTQHFGQLSKPVGGDEEPVGSYDEAAYAEEESFAGEEEPPF